MSTEILNNTGGATEPAPTPANNATEQNGVSNPEKPSEAVNGNVSGPPPVVAELEPRAGTSAKPAKETQSDEKHAPNGSRSVGDKREHDGADGPGAANPKVTADDREKANDEAEKEGSAKKQKTEREEKAPAGAKPAENSADAPKKRGPGRPKKAEGTVPASKKKKKQPTPRSNEGIGSRTRSRAK